MEPDAIDLNAIIAGLDNNPTTIEISSPVFLSGDLTIPKTVEFIVTRGGTDDNGDVTAGMIHLNGFRLRIYSNFHAGMFKVFEYSDPMHRFGEPEGVIFETGSIHKVEAMWFGVDPGGTQDSTFTLQRAIDASIWVKRLTLPAGDFRVDDTIHLVRSTSGSFGGLQGFQLEGASCESIGQTRISFRDDSLSPKKDRPLINIQYARDAVLRDLRLLGLDSQSAVEGNGAKRPGLEHWVQPDSSQGRNNPYCAVAIDGYTSHPSMGPEQLYPTDNDRNIHYTPSTSGSQDVLFERVTFEGFVVGLMISPGAGNQTDAIYVKRSQFDSCAYGVVIGSTQSRSCHVSESGFVRFYAAISNTAFGVGKGSKINCTSNQYGGGRTLYQISPGTGGPCSFSGEYCEDVVRIGTFGSHGFFSNRDTLHFSGCEFNLKARVASDQVIGTLGLLFTQNQLVSFVGCNFNFDRGAELTLHVEEGGFLFDNCAFQMAPDLGAKCNPKVWLVPGTTPGAFNRARHVTQFRNCAFWTNGNSFILGKEAFVPLFSLNAVRHPVHWSATGLRVAGGIYGEQTLAIQTTIQGHNLTTYPCLLPYVRMAEIPHLDLESPGRVLLKPYNVNSSNDWRASVRKGDRLYYRATYHPGDVYTPPQSEPLLPLVTVESEDGFDCDEYGYIYASVPELLTNPGPTEAIVNDRYGEDFVLSNTSHSTFVYIEPRTDFADPYNSQMYVILNGVCSGTFYPNSKVVTGVSNIELLRVGDFVNGKVAHESTRIASIDVATQQITLTRPVPSTIDYGFRAQIPMLLIQGTQA